MDLFSSVQRGFLRLLLALPDTWKLKILGGHRVQIQKRILDLDLQLVCKLARFNPDPSDYSPSVARKKFKSSMGILSRTPISLPKVETTLIGNLTDAIKIRIYNPDPTEDAQPTLVYFHGGGFTLGDIDFTDEVCRFIAHRTPCMVYSVNYRLAPEYPFPTPVEDCFRAYKWIRANGYRLGANPENMAVAGDSAGGNLAISVTTKCLEAGIPIPRFQGLIYPVTDLSKEHPSYTTFSHGFLLTRKMLQWFNNHYFQNPKDRTNPLASPLLIDNFKNYPTTYLATAGFDPLGDEGKALAEKMKSDGVKVVHSDFSSLTHGYFTMGSMIPSARNAIEDFIKFLKTEWST